MAIFKLSKKYWTTLGLADSEFDTLVSKGYQPIWASKGFTLLDQDGETWGKVSTKKNAITNIDPVFNAKFIEVIGHPPSVALSDMPYPAKPKPPLMTATNGMSYVETVVSLKQANKAGQKVRGTSSDSVYVAYLIADNVNLAYRFKDGSLSLRAEKFDDNTSTLLSKWGMDVKGNGYDKYASTHVKVKSKDDVIRVLGSLAFSVVDGVPQDLLAKGYV